MKYSFLHKKLNCKAVVVKDAEINTSNMLFDILTNLPRNIKDPLEWLKENFEENARDKNEGEINHFPLLGWCPCWRFASAGVDAPNIKQMMLMVTRGRKVIPPNHSLDYSLVCLDCLPTAPQPFRPPGSLD